METETKILISTEPAAEYELRRKLSLEKPAYDELQAIYAEHGYKGGDTFHEWIMAPLRKKMPGADDNGLLALFGKDKVVARVEELRRQIKYYDLHKESALEKYLTDRVVSYTKTEMEERMLDFLSRLSKEMIDLGISAPVRGQFLNHFGYNHHTDLITTHVFREECSKCQERINYRDIHPGANPL